MISSMRYLHWMMYLHEWGIFNEIPSHMAPEWPSLKSLPIRNTRKGVKTQPSLLVGMQTAETAMENRISQKKKKEKKRKIELPYDLAIPLLGVYPEKTTLKKNAPLFSM